MTSIFIDDSAVSKLGRLWRKLAPTFLFAFVLLNMSANVLAQTPPPIDWLTPEEEQKLEQSRPEIWKTNIGEIFIRDFAVLSNGDILGVGGTSDPEQTYMNASMIRLDRFGNTLWYKRASKKTDNMHLSITVLDSGQTYILSSRREENKQTSKFFVQRISTIGDAEWEIDLLPNTQSRFMSIHSGVDGGVIACGWLRNAFDKSTHYDRSIHKSLRDAKRAFSPYKNYCVKIDENGTAQWEKRFEIRGSTLPYNFILTKDGGYVTLSSDYKNGHDTNVNLVKFDTQGKQLWRYKTAEFSSIYPHSLAEMKNGHIAILGVVNNNVKVAQEINVFAKILNTVFVAPKNSFQRRSKVVLIDKDGQKISDLNFGDQPVLLESIAPSLDGGILLAGAQFYDGNNKRAYVINLDSAGRMLWDKHLQNKESISAAEYLRPTNDGNIIITSYSYNKIDKKISGRYFQKISTASQLTDIEFVRLKSKRKLNSPIKLIKAKAPLIVANHPINERCMILIDIDTTGKPFNARKLVCKLSEPNIVNVLAATLQRQYEPEYVNGKPVVSKDIEASFRITIE